MMLTSGQVSMAISSSIIIAFTIILFLCGYVLQQQTVRSLQASIRPNFPQPIPPPLTPQFDGSYDSKEPHLARGSKDHQSYLTRNAKSKATQADWKKLAYVQLVRDHSEVCAAVMLFADLARLRSPAQRILLFPQDWALQSSGDKASGDSNKNLLTSLRLLRWAARRYNVDLRPLKTPREEIDGPFPAPYSLTTFFDVSNMKRVLFLPTPGLLMDALPLDVLLGYAPDQDLGTLQFSDAQGSTNFSESILLLRPTRSNYDGLKSRGLSSGLLDSTILDEAFPDHEMRMPEGDVPAIHLGDAASLRQATDDFDGGHFEESLTFVRMQDPMLPGPEFDVPRDILRKAWPENTDAKYVYRNLYDKYRQRRMDVCGLGLEHWEAPSSSPAEL